MVERTRKITMCTRRYKEVANDEDNRLAAFLRCFKLSKQWRTLKHDRGFLLQTLFPFLEQAPVYTVDTLVLRVPLGNILLDKVIQLQRVPALPDIPDIQQQYHLSLIFSSVLAKLERAKKCQNQAGEPSS